MRRKISTYAVKCRMRSRDMLSVAGNIAVEFIINFNRFILIQCSVLAEYKSPGVYE